MPNIILQRFMIFNTSEGIRESCEGDKLIYHWTKAAKDHRIEKNKQIDDVCLCDASVNISNRLGGRIGQAKDRSFEQNISHESNETKTDLNTYDTSHKSLILTFDNTLVIIVEVEPVQSMWMAVHVSPPEVTNSNESSSAASQHSIDPGCIPAEAVKRVLRNIYARFCLLNGTFQMLANEVVASDSPENIENRSNAIRERLRAICERYFDTVLSDIHLNSILSNIASLYNYIIYLDLNPLTLMKVNSFINHLLCIDPIQILHTIVIFNDQLLWSSMNMYDTRLLYNYLVSVLIREASQEELSREVDKVRKLREEIPIFLTDEISNNYPDSSFEGEDLKEITITTTNSADSARSGATSDLAPLKLQKVYMTVFRSRNNLTLGMILKESNSPDLIQKCEHILTNDSRLGVVPLASLAQTVGKNFLKVNQANPSQSGQASVKHISSISDAGLAMSLHARQTSSTSSTSVKNQIPAEQRYIYMDRLDSSLIWPLSLDMQNKENLIFASLDNNGVEIQPSSKRMRLLKYLIDLDPELENIRLRTGHLVDQFYSRSTNDLWLTVTYSKYRAIYSVQNSKNFGLSEAHQSATNLRSLFASGRL